MIKYIIQRSTIEDFDEHKYKKVRREVVNRIIDAQTLQPISIPTCNWDEKEAQLNAKYDSVIDEWVTFDK